MKNVTLLATAISAMLVFGSAAHAGKRDPGVNARQHQQRERIQHGVRSGELTRREARGLAADQRDIRQLERAYKSDGRLSATERVDLHREQNQASREIFREKHDGQDRPIAAPGVRDPGINRRQANQTARIANGVRSGELTRNEAHDLREGRRDIRGLEQTYKADGQLTRDERVDLHQELNDQSRDIFAEKHDQDTRN